MTSNHLFHDHDEDVHVDDDEHFDGSAKDIENNYHDGAHDIADADNINDNEAAADPHLTVEDFLLECKWGGGWWVKGAMR